LGLSCRETARAGRRLARAVVRPLLVGSTVCSSPDLRLLIEDGQKAGIAMGYFIQTDAVPNKRTSGVSPARPKTHTSRFADEGTRP
jgi:hypothetical protein